MNSESRLNLERMIKEYQPEETTDKIRTLKHSQKIQQDVERMIKLQRDYKRLDFKTLEKMIQKQCNFLYTNYFNLYNRLLKGELDLSILWKLILYLKKIEDGEIDQHEASVHVGEILKKLYIDSAVRKQKKIEEKDAKKTKKVMRKAKKISWDDYKKNHIETASAK